MNKEFISKFEYNFGVYTGVRVPGYEKSKAYKLHEWDGYTLLYDKSKHRIPDGLFPQLQTFIESLQDRMPSLQYSVEDNRDTPFMDSSDLPKELYFTNEKGDKLTLLDYQDDSVRKAVDTDKGILELATNAGKCLTFNNLLLTNKGLMKIGDILAANGSLDKGLEEPNNTDIMLVNRYGELEKPAILTNNGLKHTYRITTNLGVEETSTDNHPILVMTPNGEKWKEAKDIVVGDWIVSRKGDNVYGKNTSISIDDSYLSGLLIADGYISSSKKVEFTNDQEELIDYVYKKFYPYNEKTSISTRKDNNGVYVTFAGKSAISSLHDNLDLPYEKSAGKTVPNKILQSPRDIQLAYLSGYIECEVSIDTDKLSLEISSASKEMLQQVQLMLLNIGVVSNLSKKEVNKYPGIWYGRLTTGAEDSYTLLNCLSFKTNQRIKQVQLFNRNYNSRPRNNKTTHVPYGKEIMDRYKKTYPIPEDGSMKKGMYTPKTISTSRFSKLYDKYPNGSSEMKELMEFITDKHIIFSQVVAIEDSGYEKTYDVHMPKTHSFIANGIINHNTGTSIALIEQLSKYMEKGETVAYFVPRIAIFDQAINSFIAHFGKDNVGYWGAGKKHLSKINVISMGTMVSALKNPLDDKHNYPNDNKFVGKNRTLEIFVDTVIPMFESHKNERLILKNVANNYPDGTKSQKEIKKWLLEAYETKTTDSKVRMFLNGKNAEFVKIVQSKMGDKYDKYIKALEFTKSVKVIVVDEAHHSGADGYFRTLLSFPNAQYKYAMTGSIDRHDKLLLQRMRGLYGGVINSVTNDELIERGVSAKPTITMINVKGHITLEPQDEKNFIKITELGIVKNDTRNTIITQIAKKMYHLDKPTLITVNRVEHGEILRDMLSDEDIPCIFLSGDDDSETRQLAIKGMTDGSVKVLIATSIFDEGVSVNNIRALIMAGSTKSLRLVLQRTGRSLRKKTTDNTALIFDFIDRNHPILRRHSEERLNIYKNEGYDIKYLN